MTTAKNARPARSSVSETPAYTPLTEVAVTEVAVQDYYPDTYEVSDPRPVRVQLKTNPRFWVEVKPYLTRMEDEEANDAALRVVVDERGNTRMMPRIEISRRMKVQSSLLDWNLTDAQGKAIPLDALRLKGPDFTTVWDVVNKLNSPKSEAEQVRFPERG
jgi:hypothetical protein